MFVCLDVTNEMAQILILTFEGDGNTDSRIKTLPLCIPRLSRCRNNGFAVRSKLSQRNKRRTGGILQIVGPNKIVEFFDKADTPCTAQFQKVRLEIGQAAADLQHRRVFISASLKCFSFGLNSLLKLNAFIQG